MSGFVGVLNLDGAPVDPDLLWRLTRSLGSRGPDAQNVWVQEHVGFGHTLLRTTVTASREHQPCELQGDQLWITADCRVDGRAELILDLTSHGRTHAREATDAELILHAYAVWGTDCLQHLIGDFAFAIWDGRARRLFCGRDQMGVRLFYYARIGNCLVFSNSLNTVLLHPAVSNRLNDLAVADFLVLGANQDPEATIFADVRRMLPAHLMLCSQGELRIQRYWELPIDPPLRFRRRRDYTEHFLDLFRTVMRDRLPTDRVGILMSGGLDSAGMAAIAKNLAQSESTGATGALDISAYTVVLDWLVPDRERYYSGKVASHLGIPIQYFPADDGKLFEALHSPGLDRYPDPSFMPIFGQDEASQGPLAAMARRGIRVGLYGEGPDNAMVYEWKSYVRHQLRHGSTGLLLKELAEFPFAFKEIPFVSRFSVRAKRSPEQPPEIPVIPSWLDRGFVSRLGLEERYNHLNEQAEAGPRHPVRPKSHGSFDVSAFQSLFEKFDTGVLGLPIEVRHPFMDIRMLRYLLAVPVIPWCREKYLIRQALRSYLPGEVIARPKQGLQGFPSWERWKRTGVRNDLPLDLIVNYVDVAALKTIPIDSRFLLAQFNLAAMLGFFLAQRKAEV